MGMEKVFQYATRPGSLGLSILAFAGLTLLAAMLWNVASGYVLLLFIPALALSFYQMVLSPVQGLRFDAERWTVMTDEGDREIAATDIAYLRIAERDGTARATLILTDGSEIGVPVDLAPNPLDLIQAATDHGIPVRTC